MGGPAAGGAAEPLGGRTPTGLAADLESPPKYEVGWHLNSRR